MRHKNKIGKTKPEIAGKKKQDISRNSAAIQKIVRYYKPLYFKKCEMLDKKDKQNSVKKRHTKYSSKQSQNGINEFSPPPSHTHHNNQSQAQIQVV